MIFSNKYLKNHFQQYLVDQLSGQKLSLKILQVGDNFVSIKYIDKKVKLGAKIGVDVQHLVISTADQASEILQNLKPSQGLIFQLPVPAEFETLVKETPEFGDVDLLGSHSDILVQKGFLSPTVGAIDLVLKEMTFRQSNQTFDDTIDIFEDKLVFDTSFIDSHIDLRGQAVAVVGQGVLVGRPLLGYLVDRGATIISLNIDSKNVKQLCKSADIVISGAGVPNLISSEYLTAGQIVIDAATSGVSGAIVGDVCIENLGNLVYLCPSPSGVGPLTVLYIFHNLAKLNK